MKHNLRTKFFYVLMIALMAVVAIGATPATPVNAATCVFTTTSAVVDTTGSPTVYGVATTFTATILPVAATGTVQFKDGAVDLGGPIALPAGNVVAVTVSDLDVNSGTAHPITAVYSGDANYCTSTSVAANHVVTPLTLPAITGPVVIPTKVYDQNVNTSFTGGLLTGVLFGDDVSIATRPGTYATANVGVGIAVTPAFTLGGADAGNYTITQPVGPYTANITAKPLTLTGITASNKVYDSLTTATINTSGAAFMIGEVIVPDVVTLTSVGTTGTFATKTVGTAKVVTIAGFTLTGTHAGNYALAPVTTTADITPRHLTLGASPTGNLVANNKAYDGNTNATFVLPPAAPSLTPIQGADVVSLSGTGSFADANVGTAKPVTPGVFGLAGGDAANYILDQQPVGAYTANITGPVNVITITLNNPTQAYNGSPFAADLTPTIAGGFVVPGTFNLLYNGSPVVPTNAASYTITGTFTPDNILNVNAIAAIGPFITPTMDITKVTVAPGDVAILNEPATFTGSPIAADLSAGVPGVFSSVTYDGSLTVPSAVGKYFVRAIFAPTDTTNYNGFAYSGIGFFNIVDAAPPVRTELLLNGGFNDYPYVSQFSFVQSNVPAYWYMKNFAATDGMSLIRYEGAYSVRINGERGLNRWKILHQTINIAGVAGDKLVLTMMTKNSDDLIAGNICRMAYTLYNGTTKVVNRQADCSANNANWHLLKKYVEAPADFTKIVVRIISSEPRGSLWFDAASLIHVR